MIIYRQTNAMRDSEKEKLLKDNDVNSDNKRTWRNYLIFPVVFSVFYSVTLMEYVKGEWTQTMVRKQYFPNETANFSSCENTNTSDPHYKKYQTVQQVTSKWAMIFSLAEHIPSMFAQIILSTQTDYLGRKYLLILVTTVTTIKHISIALTVYFEESFWYIAAATIVFGLGGARMGFGAAAFAYTADVTYTKTERTVGIVVIEAMVMFSILSSAYTSGLFVETLGLGFFYTSVIGTCVSFLMLVVIVILKESLPMSKRSKSKSMLTTIKDITQFYISAQYTGKRKVNILLLITFGVTTIVTVNRRSMETLYFLGRPFCWGPSEIGVFSMACYALKTIVGLSGIWFLQKYLSNATIGIIGSLSCAVSYTIEGLATSTLMIYMVAVTGIFTFLTAPVIRSIMSALTPVNKQGAMFAGVATIEVICTLIAELSQNAIYSLSLSFMNGFVFIVCAVCSVVNMALLYLVKQTVQGQETYQNPESTIKTLQEKENQIILDKLEA